MAGSYRILLLAGTVEARELNRILFAIPEVQLITALAGRTRDIAKLSGEMLRQGFDDVGGLEALLQSAKIDCIIDATHPYAATISQKAANLCKALDVQYLRYDRPPWMPEAEDIWIAVADMNGAAAKCRNFQRIFLTIGRQELALFEGLTAKELLIRSVEEMTFNPASSSFTHIQARGPFNLQGEIDLMNAHKIDAVVSKNSGGEATFAKIEAARTLSLPVIMVARPDMSLPNRYADINLLVRQVMSFV